MSMNLVTLLYLIASVCFIQSLKGLSHPTTSIRGNLFGMVGMAIAAFTTAALILKLAGYTYGPLLGLFAFALFTPRPLSGRTLVAVCLAAPALCAVLDFGQPWWGYQIGLELLLLNGLLTWAGLVLAAPRRH